ncbi:glycosyltransferase family 2 protein [Paenibacillus sp. N3.4]|uniref:glycosyltransferase family 2 protein n=1 Tax=Paenibacillus sp. N3.4 TaxID=2603222 RepID=UPI0028FCEFF8|nr:glycosyltransferase family 2 protein [Paenibacillus sp. N3.4]
MGIWILFVIGCMAGFIVFRKNKVPLNAETCWEEGRLSIIIPARNEQYNLPYLLESLQAQTFQAFEIIVVDDGSSDRTKQIAESYGVKVIANPQLPLGWTGKNWAVWNGYLQAAGELIAFMDADIRLAPHALEALVKMRGKNGGVISVVPFHHTEKWYERLALVFNVLGVFAFTSPFEKNNPMKGLYGSCILTTRKITRKLSVTKASSRNCWMI